MKNHILVVGSYEVNCSIYYDEASKEGVIIDPGADAGNIIEDMTSLGVTPLAVLLISIGPVNLKVFHTPGHSPGGLCFLDEKENLLFCGDTLFYGSIGRTDFPGCSHEQLLNSIKTKLLPLPDSIKCIPGHGPATSIGAERVNNPFLQGGNFV